MKIKVVQIEDEEILEMHGNKLFTQEQLKKIREA